MTISAPPDLLAAYRPLPGRVRRDARRRRARCASHWAHVGRVARRARPRRADPTAAARPTGCSTTTASPTTSTAGGPAPTGAVGPRPGPGAAARATSGPTIERGVIQRAELLNLVLADLYGPRDLLRRGLLPARARVRPPRASSAPCDQIRLPGAQQLFTCAVDLARDGDGALLACSPTARRRRPAPGYALENRVVVSRVFPSLLPRRAGAPARAVLPHAARRRCRRSRRRGADDPRIVVLTPRPVERDRVRARVPRRRTSATRSSRAPTSPCATAGCGCARSAGSSRVDVILRRVDAWYCDPLELRPDSQLGVPGLVEAARLGHRVGRQHARQRRAREPRAAAVPAPAGRAPARPAAAPAVGRRRGGAATTTARRHVLAHLDAARDQADRPRGRAPTSVFGVGAVDATSATSCAAGSRPSPHALGRPGAGRAGRRRPTLTDRRPRGPPRACCARSPSPATTRYAAMPGGLTRVAADRRRLRRLEPGRRASARTPGCWRPSPRRSPGSGCSGGPADRRGRARGLDVGAGRREPLLARPLRRAGRGRRAAAAGGPRPAQRLRARRQPGRHRVPARAARRAHRTSPPRYPGFVGEGADERARRTRAPSCVALVVDDAPPGHARPRACAACSTPRTPCATSCRATRGSSSAASTASIAAAATARRRPRRGRAALARPRACRACSRSSGSAPRAWCATRAGASWTPAGASSAALQLASLLRATVTVERDTATDSLLLESVLTAAESIITYRRRYRSQAQLETRARPAACSTTDNPRSLAYQLDRLGEDRRRPAGAHRDAAASTTPQRLVLEASTALRLADTVAARRSPGADGTRRDARRLPRPRVIELLCTTADAIDADHFAHLLPQRVAATSG